MSRTYDEALGYEITDPGTWIVRYWEECEPCEGHTHTRWHSFEVDDVNSYHDAARVAVEGGIPEERIFSIDEATEEGSECYWHRDGVIVYVNGYAVTRHFGGPEEGGWYYDIGNPIGSSPCLLKCEPTVPIQFELQDERTRIEEILKQHPEIDERSRFSVLGGTDLQVCIEYHMAEVWPTERPRYS
jgi:hypothetical protein